MDGIRIEGLTKTYRGGRVRALAGVSLEIRPGEAFGIIGPNGAGKTTLVGCLLGLLRPDAGTVSIDGHPPDDLAARARTGYLPERLVMDRWMSGAAFLAHHHDLAGLDRTRRGAAVAEALDRVGLALEAGAMPIRKYSRGMLQRLGLAQALLGEPRYLFLDEPVSGVDPAGILLFRRLLAEARSRGATLVVNSHQLDEVERICDRVAFVSAGRVESIETPRAAADLAHVVRVRWTAATPRAAVAADRLAAHAASTGAALAEAAELSARFRVAGEEEAARLIEALVAAGVRVAEAVPEGSRLERLFETSPTAPAAPGLPEVPGASPGPRRRSPEAAG